MEGCSAPLVVKFADTQKEKDAKRIQAIQSNLWNFAAAMQTSPIAATTPISLASPNNLHSASTHSSPFMASDAMTPSNQLHLLQQLQTIGLQQQILQGNFFFS